MFKRYEVAQCLYVWPDSAKLEDVLETIKTIPSNKFIELGRIEEEELCDIAHQKTDKNYNSIITFFKMVDENMLQLWKIYAHRYYIRTSELVGLDVEVFSA